MKAAHLSRYLSSHGEAQARAYADSISRRYACAIVIPMYDEPGDCLAHVLRHQTNTDVLVIAVVNAPDNAPPGPLGRTQKLLDEVVQATGLDVLSVDCVSTGRMLPASMGVGLARKLGSDIALTLFAQGKVENPWLYQTDADAQLPRGYFATPLPDAGAVVFAHRHVSNDAQTARAAELYDLHMRYYVAGLQRAGSSYAYPTLGSTIAIHAHAYATVRGYPRRNAAEDFYLLNKTAKVSTVTCLQSPQLTLRARTSTRVPFGTGPALTKICAGLDEDASGSFYLSYHPHSFALLADTLDYLDAFAADQAPPPEKIAPILQALGYDKVRDQVTRQYPTSERRRQVLGQWFDAGKTLRFMHEARRYFPDQPLLQTLCNLPTEQLKRVLLPGQSVKPQQG